MYLCNKMKMECLEILIFLTYAYKLYTNGKNKEIYYVQQPCHKMFSIPSPGKNTFSLAHFFESFHFSVQKIGYLQYGD